MRWAIRKEANGTLSVRRWVKGKNERLPVSKYRHLRDKPEELEAFVKRLNAPLDNRLRVEFKHAFINDELLAAYWEFLEATVSDLEWAKTEFSYLKRYALNYFLNTLQLNRVQEWHDVHKTQWSLHLRSKACPASAKTKRDIVASLNKFARWLHSKRPTEVPLLVFEPLSKKQLRDIDALRESRGETRDRTFVTEEDWAKIKKALPSNLCGAACLAYYYGLRRGETLARPQVKKGCIVVQQQLARVGVYAPTKGRKTRKVPHWFAKPAQAYTWSTEQPQMNPHTLSDKWGELMQKLGLEYDFHELRHAFVTRALGKYSPKDVMLAAGHENIETTMGYLHDDRDLDDEDFVPDEAA